ncbi:MAG TPA: hypothetical protein VGR40_10970, partial [Candidatus Binatus sp.]|nr:hypothetical protein [Candidatus Binatus sp.]
MESNVSSVVSDASVKSARCVLFAYHEMGYACIEALLKMGAPVAALFTHRDDAKEEVWWRSCADLAERHGVPVHTENVVVDSVAKVAALKPAMIYSFSY